MSSSPAAPFSRRDPSRSGRAAGDDQACFGAPRPRNHRQQREHRVTDLVLMNVSPSCSSNVTANSRSWPRTAAQLMERARPPSRRPRMLRGRRRSGPVPAADPAASTRSPPPRIESRPSHDATASSCSLTIRQNSMRDDMASSASSTKRYGFCASGLIPASGTSLSYQASRIPTLDDRHRDGSPIGSSSRQSCAEASTVRRS